MLTALLKRHILSAHDRKYYHYHNHYRWQGNRPLVKGCAHRWIVLEIFCHVPFTHVAAGVSVLDAFYGSTDVKNAKHLHV